MTIIGGASNLCRNNGMADTTISPRYFTVWTVLIVTVAVWCGVAFIGINSDDYQYVESMAPVQTMADAVRPFVSHDANPSYFRPLSNASLAMNFLAFKWNGAGY